MGEKISKWVQKQNKCNSNKDERTFEKSPLGKSCEKVVIEVLSPSLECINFETIPHLSQSLLAYLIRHSPLPLSIP